VSGCSIALPSEGWDIVSMVSTTHGYPSDAEHPLQQFYGLSLADVSHIESVRPDENRGVRWAPFIASWCAACDIRLDGGGGLCSRTSNTQRLGVLRARTGLRAITHSFVALRVIHHSFVARRRCRFKAGGEKKL
jgi:hypothetical protein